MIIVRTEENGKVAFALEGRLDTVTAPQFEEKIKESAQNVKEILIDLEKLEYISSAGLRTLLTAKKLMADGELKIINPCEAVKEVFDITGFSDILDIE